MTALIDHFGPVLYLTGLVPLRDIALQDLSATKCEELGLGRRHFVGGIFRWVNIWTLYTLWDWCIGSRRCRVAGSLIAACGGRACYAVCIAETHGMGRVYFACSRPSLGLEQAGALSTQSTFGLKEAGNFACKTYQPRSQAGHPDGILALAKCVLTRDRTIAAASADHRA